MKNKLLILYRTIMTTNPTQRDKQKRVWSHDVYFRDSFPQPKEARIYSALEKLPKNPPPIIDILSAHTP
jgi:hypothetical protein